VELGRFIRTGIAASAAGHLSILAMVLIFAEVHPFGSVTAETIAVDLVSPDEAKPAPKIEQTPPAKADPSDAFNLSSKSAPSSMPAPAPEAAVQPQKQAAPPPRPAKQQAAAQPPPPSTSPLPAYVAPEPDLAIKYHVILGLPPELPAGPPRAGDAFDDEASQKAEIASSLVTEFRRHLRTCSKLPAALTPNDTVMIKLRVLMTPEGRLAAEPVVAEGSANPKALDLKQSAIDALQACQPYTMLPADRYGEWKVLELSFTPNDFNS
jgi:hypothetical protein